MKTPSEPRALRSLRRAPAPTKSKPSSKNPTRRSAPARGTSARGREHERRSEKLHLPLANAPATSLAASAGQNKKFGCAECGLCCTYLAIEIDGPTSVKRATELLWYLYHEGVSIYVNDDSWMVQFESRCRFLTEDRRCGIYATRPHICREFSEKECEINTGDDGHTFYAPAAFMAHLKETRPRVHALVLKGFAPPEEPKRGLYAFQRRMRDVYARRAAIEGIAKPPA
jgi:Fe-S-cluster containining protein